MTQKQISHPEGLPNRAAGHLLECACRSTSKHASPNKVVEAWRRLNRPPRSTRALALPADADNVVQFNLSLAEQPTARRKAAGGAHGRR
ncbi:hypothetical protein [Stenotrophomonas indicatrix]|uniref:hypothetical protein n=1 Tax=Stenotrophomonas indicatrix TaxID=2045451 RepID=UPI000FD84361|nr:hypothetical protein [Stenotrophomonas indicatrix]